jgi:outer membrane protein TolC
VAAATRQQAEENRRIYAERYAGGLVTIQDLLQAETALKETRLLYSQNLYDMYLTYAELLSASGKAEEIRNM